MISDFGILRPHPATEELQLTALFEGVTSADAQAAVGWSLSLADRIDTVAPPSDLELEALRALHARTREAHSQPVRIPV